MVKKFFAVLALLFPTTMVSAGQDRIFAADPAIGAIYYREIAEGPGLPSVLSSNDIGEGPEFENIAAVAGGNSGSIFVLDNGNYEPRILKVEGVSGDRHVVANLVGRYFEPLLVVRSDNSFILASTAESSASGMTNRVYKLTSFGEGREVLETMGDLPEANGIRGLALLRNSSIQVLSAPSSSVAWYQVTSPGEVYALPFVPASPSAFNELNPNEFTSTMEVNSFDPTMKTRLATLYIISGQLPNFREGVLIAPDNTQVSLRDAKVWELVTVIGGPKYIWPIHMHFDHNIPVNGMWRLSFKSNVPHLSMFSSSLVVKPVADARMISGTQQGEVWALSCRPPRIGRLNMGTAGVTWVPLSIESQETVEFLNRPASMAVTTDGELAFVGSADAPRLVSVDIETGNAVDFMTGRPAGVTLPSGERESGFLPAVRTASSAVNGWFMRE